jgi:hypothetical protein
LFLTAGSEDVFQNAHGVELRAALPNDKKRSYLNSESMPPLPPICYSVQDPLAFF